MRVMKPSTLRTSAPSVLRRTMGARREAGLKASVWVPLLQTARARVFRRILFVSCQLSTKMRANAPQTQKNRASFQVHLRSRNNSRLFQTGTDIPCACFMFKPPGLPCFGRRRARMRALLGLAQTHRSQLHSPPHQGRHLLCTVTHREGQLLKCSHFTPPCQQHLGPCWAASCTFEL